MTGRHAVRTLAALVAAALAAPAGLAQAVRIVDRRPIERPAAVAGPRLAELSGLAWDAPSGELLAVSDRGGVFRIALGMQDGRLLSASVRLAARIGGTDGPKVNAESVVRDGQGRWWVADEAGHELLQIDEGGAVLGRERLPGRLRDPAALGEANSGIEALAWHPRHGRLFVPQRPLRDDPPELHLIHADDGRRFALRADARAPSRIKAADTPVEGELLLLEKLKTADGDRFQLRRLRLADCPAEQPCDPPAWPIAPSATDGLNVEGLACLGPRLCLLVNDDGRPALPGSVLLLIELPPP